MELCKFELIEIHSTSQASTLFKTYMVGDIISTLRYRLACLSTQGDVKDVEVLGTTCSEQGAASNFCVSVKERKIEHI